MVDYSKLEKIAFLISRNILSKPCINIRQNGIKFSAQFEYISVFPPANYSVKIFLLKNDENEMKKKTGPFFCNDICMLQELH